MCCTVERLMIWSPSSSSRRDVLTSLSSSNPVTFIFCTMYRVIWKSSNLMPMVICLYQMHYSHDHKSLSSCYIYLAHVWHSYNRNKTSTSLMPFTLLTKFSRRVLWWSWQIFEDGLYRIIIQPEGQLEHFLSFTLPVSQKHFIKQNTVMTNISWIIAHVSSEQKSNWCC